MSEKTKASRPVTVKLSRFEASVAANVLWDAINGWENQTRAGAAQRVAKKLEAALRG